MMNSNPPSTPADHEHQTGGGSGEVPRYAARTTTPPRNGNPGAERLAGGSAELLLGECIEIMQAMPSNHVEGVVTDPPYMIGAISTGDAKSKGGSWVDLMNASYWYGAWMAEAWRLLKPGGFMVIFTNWRSVPMLLKACSDKYIPSSSLACWDKEWIGPAGPSQLRPTYEMILFCAKDGAKIDNRSRSDVFRHKWMASHMGQSGHPAQKPVPLLKEIVELVTKPGGLVLDPFTGSGTTGIAAVQAGRRFVGIEGDEERHKEGLERLRNAVDPMRQLSDGAEQAGSQASDDSPAKPHNATSAGDRDNNQPHETDANSTI